MLPFICIFSSHVSCNTNNLRLYREARVAADCFVIITNELKWASQKLAVKVTRQVYRISFSILQIHIRSLTQSCSSHQLLHNT